MEKQIYSLQDYTSKIQLIGTDVYFFLWQLLPFAKECQQWSYMPLIGVSFGKARIVGLECKSSKRTDQKGNTIDEYTDIELVIRNPYYIKPDPVDERDGPGLPPPATANTYEFWRFGIDAYGKWFFPSKAHAYESIPDQTSTYYKPSWQ